MSFMNPSRAFRRGFVDGFASPFTLLTGRRFRFSRERRHLVPDLEAWYEVGSLLNAAYREVGEEIGKNHPKTASKDPGRQRRAG